MKKIKGFTLAEILITLAIIGVVAALTIPTVIVKNQKNELYTRFINVYSVLSRILPVIVNDKGLVANWSNEDCANVADYLKVTKECTKDEGCFAETYEMLDGAGGKSQGDARFGMKISDDVPYRIVQIGNGASFKFQQHVSSMGITNSCLISVDTNGEKGPNVWGRDLFIFQYYTFGRLGFYLASEEWDNSGFTSNNNANELSRDELLRRCIASHGKQACASVLLIDKKMNY